MKRQLLTVGLAALAAMALLLAQSDVGIADGDPAPQLVAPSGIDAHMITRIIYAGRADSALAILNSPPYAKSTDPMVFLLRSRAMREQLADEDDNKSQIEEDAKAILAVLDDAVELCDRALENETADPIYLYYRGRAKLGKAQLYTLTRSYWGAGRNGAAAKGDLEEFLAVVPDAPDAQGDLGAFLYFADTLPGFVKFLGKLLFIPSGDRELGLEMLEYAATHNAVFEVDYQIALAAIDLLFEGLFGRGAAAMEELIARHPGYTRLVEPFGVMAPLVPLQIRDYQDLEDEVIATHLAMKDGSEDWSLIRRIQVHRTYTDMYFKSPAGALPSFTAFVDNPVERPDWLLPLVLINRGQLYAKSGLTDRAREDFNTVLANKSMEHFHDLANDMIGSLDKGWKVIDLAYLDFVGAIYDRDLETAKTGLDAYGREYGRDVIYFFYLGEIAVFAQDFAGAQRAFETCLKIDVVGGDQSYQMYACLRLAELVGQKGQYKSAEDYVKKSTDYVHVGYLLDFLISSRQQYFKLLQEGTIDVRPTLLIEQSAANSTVPRSAEQTTDAHD